MSNLSSIRTMQELERQRALLQQKAQREEQRVRKDIDGIREDYMPVVHAVNGIRSGVSRLKTILAFALPVFNFFRSKRQKK